MAETAELSTEALYKIEKVEKIGGDGGRIEKAAHTTSKKAKSFILS